VSNLVEILPLALILLVSSVPVALSTMFTVTMALSSLELAKKGVLVHRFQDKSIIRN
jgi:H+-transporting ATPase